jgi:hypothetical protein
MATKTLKQATPEGAPANEAPKRTSKKKDAANKAALLAQALSQQNSKVDVEERRTRLKNLIMLGKERGYLTYAEVNDHLPDEMLDAEQIESVISMINDMGIQVFDQAPAAEDLLMSENPAPVADEDAVEAAEAALSNVDAEFGRTTDPVRMYMREMGTKDLLTREGEIEIAKRIEEGLKHMVLAISACPLTITQILDLVDKVEKDEMKVDDLVDGLMDSSGEDVVMEATAAAALAAEEAEAADDEGDEDDDGGAAINAANLAQLRTDALERFADPQDQRQDAPGAGQIRFYQQPVPETPGRTVQPADGHPFQRAPGRQSVHHGAQHRRGSPRPRTCHHGSVGHQERHAARAFHQDFPRPGR